MPAALLLAWHRDGLPESLHGRFDAVAAAMPGRVREMAAHDHATGRLRLRTWTHRFAVGAAPAIDPGTGAWLTAVGNPTRQDVGGLPGDAALQRLLRDARDSVDAMLDGLSPPFATVFAEGADGPVHVAVDRCGVQHLYAREEPDGTVWIASSALALAEALGATLDEEATAEWLAAGHFVSQRTFAREVRKLGPGERLELGHDGCLSRRSWRPPADPEPSDDGDYRAAFLEALAACQPDGGAAAELTGGLDSRLVLAGRLRRELPTLSWTLGQPGSGELRVVDRLRVLRRFEHIPVTLDDTLGPALPGLTGEMHELADGEVNALEYAPLLVAFAALEGRRGISISGSGGEIARSFYGGAVSRAPGGAVDVDGLVHKLVAATGPVRDAMRRDVFPDPTGPLRRVVTDFVEAAPGRTPAAVLDDFYVRARMQRFAGRNITTTGLFCRQALPFFENRVVDVSFGLPAERKRQGRVVRDAIAAWTPDLARVPLDSGMAVRPRSWRAPAANARWATAMARKVAGRYGGTAGRRLAARAPEVVPWSSVRSEPAFRAYVRDLLPESGSRVHALLDPTATSRLIDAGLAGGSLYPLGLVITLELTLRRLVPTRRR